MRVHLLLAIGLAFGAPGDLAHGQPLRLDFSPSPLEGLLQRAEEKAAVVEVPRCAGPLIIDGDPQDAAWQAAAVIQVPAAFSGARALPATRALLCYDDAALYIGVVCHHQPGQPPVGQERKRDEGAWQDDCVEVWLDTSREGDAVYQFVVNAAGAIYDQNKPEGPHYDPEWQQAVGKQDGAWTVEIAIPLRALQLAAWPANLNFNIGRNGPDMTPRAYNGGYGDTSAGLLRLAGIGDQATAQEQGIMGEGEPLDLHVERDYARPGDRWIEAGVRLGPGVAPNKVDISAELLRPGGGEPAAEVAAVPPRREGKVLADLRSLGLSKARLTVKLHQQGRLVAQAEVELRAEETHLPLQPGQRIPVRLDLPEGIDAVQGWPVVFGVPFPAGALWDADAVRLIDGTGREIPHQRQPVGLWGKDGAIQWLRFDALVSSDDGCSVEVGPPGEAAQPPAPVTVREQGANVILDTGAARYVLGKGTSPIEEVWMGDKRIASAAGTRGLYVVDQNGRVASAAAEDEDIEIEARGPVAACVRFEGVYATADGEELARHITRVEAFAGQPFASITHTLVLTRDTNEVWFTDIGWEFAVEAGANASAIFGTSRDEWGQSLTHSLEADARAYMLQDRHYHFAHDENHFVVASEAGGEQTTLLEGEECGDWAALAGGAGAFAFSCRESARQHPKEFEVSPDRIVLHLFSSRAGEQLDFRGEALAKRWDLATWYDAVIPEVHKLPIEEVLAKVAGYTSNAIGWAKTHELMIAPLAPRDHVATDAARLSRLHSHRVFALADPQWICDTEAMGPIWPRDEEGFPEIEAAISAAIRQWHDRIADWGDYGFVEYYEGPHLGYRGKYVNQKRYSSITYTLRPDLWLMYARSGDRDTRQFISDSIRTNMDGCFAHWDGPRKTRGLWLADSGSDLPTGGVRMGQLPFHWESATYMHKSSSTNLNNWAWHYYLTGYRRAKDFILEHLDGVKRVWTPAQVKRDGRPLMILRVLTQGYAFTWDPELRAMAEATTDVVADPDAPLGYTQVRSSFDQPKSTLYKTQVDVRALMDAWRVFGERRYYDMALKTSRYWWQQVLGSWPLFYTNPQGVAGSFLYEDSGDRRYAQGLLVQMRQAASAYDPETDHVSGVHSAEKTTFLFEGTAHAQRVLVDSGADKGPVAAWAGYEDFGMPSSLAFRKAAGQELNFDIRTPGDFKVVPAGQTEAAGLPWIVEETYGNRSISIPADAPEGEYEIVPAEFGMQLVIADRGTPLVVHAPDYWRPAPAQSPAVPYYFKVPENARGPQIMFEGSAKLFDPEGQSYQGGEPLHGWIDLPADRPGLWSFLPVDNQLVKARNLPPFFAVESRESYFEPAIEWHPEASAEIEEVAPGTEYIAGAIDTPGNQALYLGGKRSLRMEGGPAHASGDGNQFLPFKEGTIEFWFRPSWGTVALPLKSKTILRLEVAEGDSWRLYYMMAPRSRDASADFYASHVLYGYFYSDGPKKRITMRAYRRTVFERNEWVHVAWVWGLRHGIIPGHGTRPAEDVLVAELYINGRKGQQYGYKWKGNLPVDMPVLLHMYQLDAAVDELRLSDIQRYTEDFEPPSRDREFELDEHTRALLHFNGNLEGESHGHAGPLPAEAK